MLEGENFKFVKRTTFMDAWNNDDGKSGTEIYLSDNLNDPTQQTISAAVITADAEGVGVTSMAYTILTPR